MNKYACQKWFFALFLILVNGIMIAVSQLLLHVYPQGKFYAQIPLMVTYFYKVMTVLIVCIAALFKRYDKGLDPVDVPQRTLVYMIPCYNESEEELRNTINSFNEQDSIQKHKKIYITICDGRKTGKGNPMSTDKILSTRIYPDASRVLISDAYVDRSGQKNRVEILYGYCQNNFPYFVIIKDKNGGKRDSIATVRRLLYRFKRRHDRHQDNSIISDEFLQVFQRVMATSGIVDVHHLIGVDADTFFQRDATIGLLREIQRKQNILASTGLVRVMFLENPTCSEFLWQGYQHVQYITGQGLIRTQQHLTQQKLNCLPGCINITRINQKTCGELLMEEYMRMPTNEDSIFAQIRGHLSQDRHSSTIMLKLYSEARTTATWDAHSVTGVPTTWRVFLSQRKRWSLGATCNCAWMVIMPNVPLWERFSNLCLVITYILSPYFLYSMILWIVTLATTPSHGQGTLFWVLTCASQLPTIYKLFIPCWMQMTHQQVKMYYLFFPISLLFGPTMGLIILIYSVIYMDDFGWGKTRETTADGAEALPVTANNLYEEGAKKQQLKQGENLDEKKTQILLLNDGKGAAN